MTACEQITWEAKAMGKVALAIFASYPEPVGRGTETWGDNAGRYYAAILKCANAGPHAPLFTAAGMVLLIPVSDVDRAVQEIREDFRRFNSEASSLCARQLPDGSWQQILPTPGVPLVLPEEIHLPPADYWDVCDKLAKLKEERAKLAIERERSNARLDRYQRLDAEIAQMKERLHRINSDLSIALISEDEASNLLGSMGERIEAIALELGVRL